MTIFRVHIPGVWHGTVEAASRRDVTMAASKRWPHWRRVYGARVSRIRFTKFPWRERDFRRLLYREKRYPTYE